MTVFRIIGALFCFITASSAMSWNEQGVKGWLWYKSSPKKTPQKKKEEASKTPVAPAAAPITYRDRLKKEQEEFEEIQARAVVEPTLQNVQALQQAQNALMNQSEGFGKLWMLASLLDAKNYRETDQPYPLHRKILQEKEEKQLNKKIKKVAQTYGLFFVFKKGCPYCHEFSPIVRQFIDAYGFSYKAISPDGHPLPQFPDAVTDNGTIQIVNPDGIYPALFLVNPQTRDVIPLARGLVNLSDLRTNMKTIIDYLEKGPSHGR